MNVKDLGPGLDRYRAVLGSACLCSPWEKEDVDQVHPLWKPVGEQWEHCALVKYHFDHLLCAWFLQMAEIANKSWGHIVTWSKDNEGELKCMRGGMQPRPLWLVVCYLPRAWKFESYFSLGGGAVSARVSTSWILVNLILACNLEKRHSSFSRIDFILPYLTACHARPPCCFWPSHFSP